MPFAIMLMYSTHLEILHDIQEFIVNLGLVPELDLDLPNPPRKHHVQTGAYSRVRLSYQARRYMQHDARKLALSSTETPLDQFDWTPRYACAVLVPSTTSSSVFK